MAIKYGFFNSVAGDRVYNAEDIGRYLQGIVSSGVYADRSDSLQVLANGDMTITVQPGRAMLNCHYMENDAPLVLELDPADNTRRIDAVVMRLDLAERTCSIYVKTGIPAVGQIPPPSPDLTRYDNAYEWLLAEIFVAAHTTAITQSSINDYRADTSKCGWVTGVLHQVDTSTLFAQWQAAYAEQYGLYEANIAAQAAAYNEWLASLVENDEVNKLPVPTPLDAGGAVIVGPSGDKYVVGNVPNPYTKDEEYPTCYRRIVGAEKEWLNPPRVWAAKNDAYCVYRAMLTAERWADYTGTQRPVYVVDVDVYDMTAKKQSFAVQLPDGAQVVGLSGIFDYNGTYRADLGVQPTPAVIVDPDGVRVAASAKFADGMLDVFNHIGVTPKVARFTIKYVL